VDVVNRAATKYDIEACPYGEQHGTLMHDYSQWLVEILCDVGAATCIMYF
jgi:hypothetical protein